LAELSSAHIVHRLPDRVRLRVPARRRDVRYFAEVARVLGGIEGVTVKARAGTGSIVVARRGLDIEALAALARERRLFALTTTPPAGGDVIEAVGAGVDSLEGELRRATGGGMNLASITFLCFVAVGLAQLLRGNIAAPAFSMFWYAAGVAQMATMQKQLGAMFGDTAG
jgi:hypothetical protein